MGSGSGGGASGYASGLAAGIMREASFKASVRTLRKRSAAAAAAAAADAGFTTFTSGIRAGWQRELASIRFRQVRSGRGLWFQRSREARLSAQRPTCSPTHSFHLSCRRA